MAVCILTSSYPRFPGDYAGIFVAELARELAKLGEEVVVLAPRAPGVDAFEISNGVRVCRFSYFFPRKWELLAYGQGIPSNLKRNPLLCLLLPFFLAGQVRALKRLLHQDKIHVVNAHWMLMQGLAAAWVHTTNGFRVVLTFHSEELRALVRFPFARRLTDWIVRRADHIFSVSSAHGRLLSSFLGREIPLTILPMGIDTKRFDCLRWPKAEARRRLGVVEGQVLLFLGRLEERKGVRVLIRSLREMPSFRLQRAVLLIAGEGNEKFDLEREVRQFKLEECVRFLGRVSRDEVPWLLAAADIVCVPSIVEKSGLTEGLPVVVLEAMAMAKVVVASRVGGIPDVIQDSANGFLAAPGNSQAWAVKLGEVMTLGDKITSVRQAARRTAEKFSWESVAQSYVAVFQSLQRPP